MFIKILTSINKYHFLLIAIFLLGFFLRFYRINENFIFSGEVGDNLLQIKKFYLSGQVPLLGPPTSHPWLYFGPFFYWIYSPVLILFKFNPLSHVYFGAFLSLMIIPLNFLFVRKLFGSRPAMISSFLISISPLFLSFSLGGRFFSIISVLIYPLMYSFYKVLEGNKKYMYSTAFVYSIMFGFHYSQLMLLPFFLLMITYKKIKLRIPEILLTVLIFLVPFIPFAYYDLTNKTNMIKNLILWIPYRIAGFIGVYPKNTLSEKVLTENTSSIIDFINQSFLFRKEFSIIFLLIIVFTLISIVIQKRNSLPHMFITLWFFVGILAVFIHGNPPIHYFLPIFPIPIIIFSIIMEKVYKNAVGKYFFIIILFTLFTLNMKYLFSSQWFYKPTEYFNNSTVSYNLQLKIADTIKNDSNDSQFILKRVGQNDKFENDYAQNYMYLLWLKGNEPKERAELSYTIYEDTKKLPKKLKNNEKILQVSNIRILKSQ